MKKIIGILFSIFLLQSVKGQTETFDIATYTAPSDWKKNVGAGFTSFSKVNSVTGGFCVLALYASSASLGDAQKDFAIEWNGLAVTPHNAQADPKTDKQSSPDGWQVVAGAAPVKLDKIDAYMILTVFSGFGKRFSVLSTLNDQSYMKGIDSFLEHLTLDKTGATAMAGSGGSVAYGAPGGRQDESATGGTKGQYGTMMYRVPKGWQLTKYPDGDIMAPVELPQGEFLEIWIQPSVSGSGSLEDALQKGYEETTVKLQAKKMREVNGGNYSVQAVKKSYRGWEYIRCSGGIKMGAGDYPPEYGLDLFVIKLNGRFEQVSVIKSRNNCGMSTYYPSGRLNYYEAIENLLFSLQFPDWAAPELKAGGVKGEGITGAWEGISMSVGMTSTGAGLGAALKTKELIFFSNGQAFFGTNFPTEGLNGLNTRVKAEDNRRDWGTYSFEHGNGVLTLPYAEIPLRMENGRLIVTTDKTDHAFIKLSPVDGARFEGVYALSSKSVFGQETGKTPLIRFTADGKFSDEGAMKILYHEYVDCMNLAKDAGSGTYEVKDYSVVFNYADGRRIKIAFPGKDYDRRDQSPATLTLSFNGDLLKNSEWEADRSAAWLSFLGCRR